MIPIDKLQKLSPRHRMRKMALVLGEIECGLLARREEEVDETVLRYGFELSRLLASENGDEDALSAAAISLSRLCDRAIGQNGFAPVWPARMDVARAVDTLRHALIAATGQAPADWDLLDPGTGLPDPASRKIYPGRKVYLEDLRSPFNVGSVFRTADAFGVEELILSPSCADPFHPRARRSAMGAIDLLSWRKAGLESLSGDLPVFALELGGVGIDNFSFPEKGIVILGSEELGVSRQARNYCTRGMVSIPMVGAKGSLNVAVAFGILMYAWTHNLV